MELKPLNRFTLLQLETDDILLTRIKTESSDSFGLLYKFYFPSIASYIRKNMGTSEDAEDIFQEAIIVLLQKVRQPDFVLTASLKTFLYAIAKNLWLKRLRGSRRLSLADFEKSLAEPEIFDFALEESREEQVSTWLGRVTKNCQRILKALFYSNEPMDSLLKKMGWKNKHTAANQQYKCIQQVKKEKERAGLV